MENYPNLYFKRGQREKLAAITLVMGKQSDSETVRDLIDREYDRIKKGKGGK